MNRFKKRHIELLGLIFRHRLIFDIVFWLVTFLLAYLFFKGYLFVELPAWAFSISLVHSFGSLMSLPTLFRPKVMVYFTKRLNAFAESKSLFKHIEFIDDVAIKSGTKPLSRFLSKDDLWDEEVIWHHPSEGINLIENLILSLPDDHESSQVIKSDLIIFLDALKKASDAGLQFCILVILGDENVTEARIRKGYF